MSTFYLNAVVEVFRMWTFYLNAVVEVFGMWLNLILRRYGWSFLRSAQPEAIAAQNKS
ncbi:MAG: hypothetical protein LBR10_13755 [Prevotellaceae bacterium]|jgi:hypothetical protein|nr:hypothetical protein [Prevotellaceae bacterium]